MKQQQQSTLHSQSASTLAVSVDIIQAEQQKIHAKHTTGKTEAPKGKVCGKCSKFSTHKVQQCPGKDVTYHKYGKQVDIPIISNDITTSKNQAT